MGDFPIGQFIILTVVLLGIAFSISLLIASGFSENKEDNILKQLWQTFWGSPTDPDDHQSDHH